uniref:C2 domain-containing protein n=1 Tax=Parascaris equorum TaxID=6256 RepID=A0A914RBJ3_PAREQ
FNNANTARETALLDAYVNVDCDEYHVGQTVTRPKTRTPVWNEDYEVCFKRAVGTQWPFDKWMRTEVHNGRVLGFTVFHDCALPPDDFVANCRLQFEDLKIATNNDIWVRSVLAGLKYSITYFLATFAIVGRSHCCQIDLEPHGQLHVLVELHGVSTEVVPQQPKVQKAILGVIEDSL